ncbi:hypothetical protein [Sphingomonas sp.]|uniref:hypothetical protein n=1 Tax=Sphingomonas sp. TaxID=28214 RepID=UPI002D15260D|nr:hypothetical protein [Sphingomonas sp.]HTG37366.1 hypothetical protein [Sphingomonas sp.]
MKLSQVLAAAGAIWRAERSLVMPLAGLFYFVPSLALLLMLPEAPPPADPGSDAALDALLTYARDNAGAIIGANAVQLVGAILLYTLFLAPSRPTLGEAFRLIAPRLLSFALASILTLAALTVSALLIVPALYLIGRFFLVGAVIAAERRSPVEAIARSIELTRGRGWWCFIAAAVPFLAGQVIVTIAGGFDGALVMAGVDSAVGHLFFNGIAALGATLAWTLTLLVKIIVYRRLSNGT